MVQDYISGVSTVSREMLVMSMIPGAMGVAMVHGVGGAVPVAWNPLDKNANVSLSGNNLIASNAATGSNAYCAVRATRLRGSGGVCSLTITALNNAAPSYMIIGLGTLAATLSGFPGVDA